MKTEISAKIITDSISQKGNRITTMELIFPRFILAELNTHRMFSKNSASSRAIPFDKMMKEVQENPFIPIAWQKNHKGMQGIEYLTEGDSANAISLWLSALDDALTRAQQLNRIEVTKQLCNRLLEPFMWHKVLLTATDFENFFNLRCPQYHSPVDTHFRHRSKKDCIAAHSNPENLELMSNFIEVDWLKMNEGQAEIHMMALAESMWDALNESTPKELEEGDWHIPYGDKIDYIALQRDLGARSSFECDELKIKIATAMCARVSYTTVGKEGKESNYEADLKLHDRLLKSGHFSPFEHCAMNTEDDNYYANFKGWQQYRKQLEK